MKKTVFMLLALSLLTCVSAQSRKCSVETKALVKERVENGETTIGFLAKMAEGFNRGILEKEGIRIGAQAGQIVTLKVPADKIHVLDANREVLQYSIAHRIGGMDCTKARIDTHVDSLHAGKGVVDGQKYRGEGVYIGITDWGFDYLHPNLSDAVGNPRTVRVWDHYRTSGPAPIGFDYGTELADRESIVAAGGDTSNLYGYGTHGTHVAGIAGGRGRGSKFIGMAPLAEFLLCSFGLCEDDWMNGVEWMRRVAAADGKRLVVNSSWGMYSFSTLDGTSLLSQAINSWADSGTVFCTSAGNNGDRNFHIQHTFRADTVDTLRTVAQYYTYNPEAIGECLIMWGDREHDFEAGFRMRRDTNIWCSPMYNTADFTDGDVIYDTLMCDTIAIPYVVYIEHENIQDGRPHIQMDVNRNDALELQLFITANGGTVHAWNVANKTNHAGNEGSPFATNDHPGFSHGDAMYGIGEPACAEKCISVSAHDADHWNTTHTQFFEGDKASFTSSGPVFGEGFDKPDISAPGYQVISSISSYASDINDYRAEASVRLENGRNYIWSPLSGTSMSCPAVSGIVALMLEANPGLSTEQVRDIIRRTARNDSITGPLLERDSLSLHWGWGKIDALKAVNEAIRTVSIEAVEKYRMPIQIYPNPTTGRVTVNTGCGEPQTMEIYSIDGRLVSQRQVETECSIDTHGMPQGVYIVRIGSRTERLVVR